MLYAKRTVKCSAIRMSKEDARESLERQFESAEVIDLKRRGDKWVATLLEPKTAEFPPSKDDESSGDAPPFAKEDEGGDSEAPEDGPPSDDGPPSPDSEGDGPPKEKKGEGAELGVLLEIVTQIADKLGIMPPGAPMAPGAEDPMGGPPPGPPAPAGPPGGGHPGNEILHRTKLKPGETPPGGTPVGAPAFASTDFSRLASFDAFDDTPGKSIKQAHTELTRAYGPHGFVVRQIKRVENGQRLAAKLSRR